MSSIMQRSYHEKGFTILLLISLCSCQVRKTSKVEGLEIKPSDDFGLTRNIVLNGTLFRTVKRYYCRVDLGLEPEFLLYGTKGWAFPAQDVTLNLTYPTKKREIRGRVDYVLTEFEVIFYIKGASCTGYISEGGILQNNINLTFMFKNITRLSFQFYLYGVPASSVSFLESYSNFNTTMVDLC